MSDDIKTKNASQANKDQVYDGLIFELTPDLKTLNWLTYFGGNGSEALYSIKLDKYDNIYVGGGTTSSNIQTPDTVITPNFQGKTDGLIAVFDKKNKSLKRATYWGTRFLLPYLLLHDWKYYPTLHSIDSNSVY